MAHAVPLDDSDAFAPVRLWLPALPLARCVRAILVRDTRDRPRVDGYELCHYPATPLCSLSWLFEGRCHWREVDGEREAVTSPLMFTGPQRLPNTLCMAPQGSGLMLLFYPDALAQLTGLDLSPHLNRALPARQVLPTAWLAWAESVMQAPDDAIRVQAIEDFLTPLWQAAQAELPGAQQLSLRLKDWSQGLGERANTSQLGRSLRQMERRIKQWTGQPLRELRGLGRAEAAFFQAMEAMDMNRLSWSEVATGSGYSDQAHLCRDIRRITGFSPQVLRQRMSREEGFWIYRAWAKAGGLI